MVLDQIQCHHFPLCSGCEFQENVSHPPLWKDIKVFFQSVNLNLDPPLKHGEIIGWRTRSKLAVRGTYLNPEIGLFKKGTHEVVPIPDCPLHNPYINRCCQLVLQKMKEGKIEPYNEEKRTGMVRYLQFVVERRSRRISLSVVVNRRGKDPQLDRFVNELYKEGGFHGIWVNYQPDSTNRIFGDEWSLLEGEPYTWEKLNGIEVCFHPASFAQAHLNLFEEMLKSIEESILSDKKVVEFYAGVGVIGFNVAAKSAQVICNEINPYAEECFHLSKMRLGKDAQGKVSFVLGEVSSVLSLTDQAEVVIVDPPRKGLDPKLLEKLCQAPHLQQIIYVSCGVLSFQRDCEKLLSSGWEIEKAEGYLLFPGSNHVEILCVLKKS